MNVIVTPEPDPRALAAALRAGDPGPGARVAVADLLDSLAAIARITRAVRPLADEHAEMLLDLAVAALDTAVSAAGPT